MRFTLNLATLLISLSTSQAFIGLGISMYNPSCAFSYRAVIASVPLECSEHGGTGGHMGHGSSSTTPECRAGNTPFLTTLAWCINSTCADFDVDTWKLEKYWREKATGDTHVLPKWSYAEAPQQASQPPAGELDTEETLNSTVIVPRVSWQAEKNSMEYFEKQETWHARYGLVLLVTGFATPILFTLLCQVPFVNRVFDNINPYIIYPSFVGTYQVQPLPYILGNAPTTGQAIYVVLFAILNIILTVVNYPSTRPNTWFEDAYQEIMAYVANRTGVIAFAVLPLVILFSGRNNILLWLTNWSHSTYMLLHRWVARIFAVQVIVHSIVELVLYIDMGSYEEELIQPYWICGIVATVATCIMLLTSILRSATVVEISEHIVRVDIQDVEWSAYHSPIGKSLHAYAYFPTLNPYRPWENHPFSIIPTAMLHPHTNPPITTPSTPSTHSTTDPEKSTTPAATTTTPTHPQPPSTRPGLTLYIRKSTTKGLTSHLCPTTNTTTLPTLLDGPYPSTSAPAGPLQPDRILLIAGGIGITGVLPHLSFGTSFNTDTTVALHWSLKARDEGLARDLGPLLEDVHGTGRAEVVVSVGRRLEAEEVLEREAATGWRRIRVVVCGPGGLCDRVRAGVVAVGRRTGKGEEGKKGRTVWDLDVDAFSW